jgi:carboxymethylenebutenolidase
MKTQIMGIKTQDGVCDVFIAYPEDTGAYPAILFFMDGFGPRAYLYEMAKTIAARGYYVLLPNMFYRIRRAPVTDIKFPLRAEDMADVVKLIMPLFKSYNPEFGMRDTATFLDFLDKQKQVIPGKIGTTGYCMGGGLSIRSAARYPDRIKVAASFHAGNLATEAPDSPHLLLNRVKAELYIAHADKDQSMPAEQIERLNSALEKAGVRYEAELYSGASHGFTMADLPAYNEAALQRHWNKLFELFERTLGSFNS